MPLRRWNNSLVDLPSAVHQRVKSETTRTRRFLRIFGIGKTAGHIIDDAVTVPGALVTPLAMAIANKAAINHRRLVAATVSTRLTNEIFFSLYSIIARIAGKETFSAAMNRMNRNYTGIIAVKRAYQAAGNNQERVKLVDQAVAQVYPNKNIEVDVEKQKVVVRGDLGPRTRSRVLAQPIGRGIEERSRTLSR